MFLKLLIKGAYSIKKAMINYIQKEKFDDLYTPYEAIEPLLKHIEDKISKDKIIWEPCDVGQSKITEVFKKQGYKVLSSDIKTGFDFLQDNRNDFDVIITNPPYSLKNEFLTKCYEYKKPFLLLLPLTALEGVHRNKLYRKYGISIILLDRRINFMKDKKSNWFNTSWFTWGIFENNSLIFEKINKGIS